MNSLSVNWPASFFYFLFMKSYSRARGHKKISEYWWKLWKASHKAFSNALISTTIHGYRVRMNYGYTYPLYSRMFPSLNNPLVELAYQSYRAKGTPINLIDVGSAIGDTILLLCANCPDMIGRFYCVDGDKEFFSYLQNNLGSFKNGKLILSMLSDKEIAVKDLVRIHDGTASAQAEMKVSARSLDAIALEVDLRDVDMLKIDVDGFDGKVLAGAKNILTRFRPSVIFEWHPILCKKTENSFLEHFEALEACGYKKFIFFDKFGKFSHFMNGFDRKNIYKLAESCLRNEFGYDWHYDIVALHERSEISPVGVSELTFAEKRKSKH